MLNCQFRSQLIVLIAVMFFASAPLLMLPSIATAQVEASGQQAQKAALEISALRQEIAQLKKPAKKPGFDWDWWLGHVGSFVAGGIAAWAGLRQRQGATDHPVHEKRLTIYPELVKITAPLAIYFPDTGKLHQVTLSPAKCADIGRALSKWYFDGGGLLMSGEARDAYFCLAQALTRASKFKLLHAPVFPEDSQEVSDAASDEHRSLLFIELRPDIEKNEKRKTILEHLTSWLALSLTLPARREGKLHETHAIELASSKSVRVWKFGELATIDPKVASEPYQRFRDYVFLQNLSSKMRTALAADIRGRRRPD